ncbi:endonuclease domain-containing protein [Hyphomonas oceanitis]|uniref:DUF559 domain-containing protein n=1 Tax=Hyphomonas oceanitis SCH89 TaxID=1280953 RepID=A0A059G920_9PROT|nr:DUF559 domain-containing protein [Hyphomonas oceanitis]KDA02953.1 hypothetical protein HOC_08407 [Hyphomonas oceanitis SCH89]
MPRSPDISRARRLRQTANAPEAAAWQALRTLRADGFPVRRQHPIAGYVVDFAIPKAWLVIEIDGSIHDSPEGRSADARRQSHIEQRGWHFLRVDTQTALSADHLLAIVTERLGL